MRDFEVFDDRIVIDLPYHPDAPQSFRFVGGKWDGERWVVPVDKDDPARDFVIESVKGAIKELYGYDVDDERRTVRIRFKDGVRAKRRPYILGGKALAVARGRDSGARVGDGVRLISGRIDSGGSMKNWESLIYPDSEFIVYDFPIHADLGKDADVIEIEAIDDAKDDDRKEDCAPVASVYKEFLFSDHGFLYELAKNGATIVAVLKEKILDGKAEVERVVTVRRRGDRVVVGAVGIEYFSDAPTDDESDPKRVFVAMCRNCDLLYFRPAPRDITKETQEDGTVAISFPFSGFAYDVEPEWDR